MDTRQQKARVPWRGVDINCSQSLPISLHFRRKEKQVSRATVQGTYNSPYSTITGRTLSTQHQGAYRWVLADKVPFLASPALNCSLSIFIHSSIHSSDTRAPNLVLCISGTGSSGANRMSIVTLDVELTEQWRCHCYSVTSSYNRELWLGKFRVL